MRNFHYKTLEVNQDWFHLLSYHILASKCGITSKLYRNDARSLSNLFKLSIKFNSDKCQACGVHFKEQINNTKKINDLLN